MVFSSGAFLFLFLPVVLVAHTLIKNNTARNILLIVASLIFYAYGEPVYVFLLLGSVTVNYFLGRILLTNKSRLILVLAVVLNIGLLVVYKYLGFLTELINLVPCINIPEPEISMPIGISFYTFQAISYVIDSYRSSEQKPPSFFEVLLYISLFPQLIAGPIVKYNSIKDTIADRRVTVSGLSEGMRRFFAGLGKKMLIANTMAVAADAVFSKGTGEISMGLAWVGGLSYMLQIYFDFSGYSDMALGIGRMLGFEFPENFNYPYTSSGIRDFWRRWHMSLTGWFREYLYIPLGGNRRGKARQILNSMIVFLCTGIWHGANLTFLFWGFMHGCLMSVETALAKKKDSGKFNPLKWIYTMIFVLTGFVIFRADSMEYAFGYIGRMFSFSGVGGIMNIFTPTYIVTLAVALVAATPIIPFIRKYTEGRKSGKVFEAAGYVLGLVLYVLCVMNLAVDSYNPFIYFRF